MYSEWVSVTHFVQQAGLNHVGDFFSTYTPTSTSHNLTIVSDAHAIQLQILERKKPVCIKKLIRGQLVLCHMSSLVAG